MEKFSFFNDVDDDRTYFAEDFASFFVPFFTQQYVANLFESSFSNDSSDQ